MKPNPHYIVAVDFTPACRRALREGVRRAAKDGADVTAVHVLDVSLVEELKKALSIEESAVRAEWEGRLRQFVDSVVVDGKQVKIELRIASPLQGLISACHYHPASLLIMGASGTGSADHRIGTVAVQCVRKAPAMVMVVKHDTPEEFKNILACVDFSPNSVKAVKQALHLAQQDGATVHCLFVYQSALSLAMTPGDFIPPIPLSELEEAALKSWQKQLDDLVDPLARETPSVEVKKIVDSRPLIRESILEHAKKAAVDLVVLGTSGKGRIRHLLMGTTAEKIIQHAPCSILAVKPDESDSDLV
jgi:nucleotide-binding universal stress UspA family protein